jgi:hypothetical protein
LVGVLGAAEARAASFTISGGSQHATPKDDRASGYDWWGNQVIPLTPGYLGAQLAFQGTADSLYDITFQFLGFEAEWIDQLRTAGGEVSNRAQPGATVAVRLRATGSLDLVPFSFLNGSSSPQAVENGTNVLPTVGTTGGAPNFFLGIVGASSSGIREGRRVYLALDDHGAGPDVDHDDWVGIVQAEQVAEPSLLLLLATGLASLSRRLRR